MKRKHRLTLMMIVAAAVWVVGSAAEKVVILTNGRQLVGEVTETKDGWQIRKPGGVLIVLGADDVARIEDVKTPEIEYQRRLAGTDQKDPEKLYQLARWATDRNMLTEARDVLKKVLKLKPDDENAKLLLRLVEIRLRAATRPAPPGATTREGVGVRIKPSELLKKEDIYRIRLHELRENDRVRIKYRGDVLDRFVKSMRGVGIFAEEGGEVRFRRAPALVQVRYILENIDRDSLLRNDILIESDPLVMSQFRTRIWQIISKGCATASCHGGIKGAGGLRLFSASARRDQVVYTNFYILTRWSRSGRKLMKRDNPEMSLLLQYGLPKGLARLRHSDRVRSNPIFRNPADGNYKILMAWLKLLKHPVPGGARPYGIIYKIPGQPEPTTIPSIYDD